MFRPQIYEKDVKMKCKIETERAYTEVWVLKSLIIMKIRAKVENLKMRLVSWRSFVLAEHLWNIGRANHILFRTCQGLRLKRSDSCKAKSDSGTMELGADESLYMEERAIRRAALMSGRRIWRGNILLVLEGWKEDEGRRRSSFHFSRHDQ